MRTLVVSCQPCEESYIAHVAERAVAALSRRQEVRFTDLYGEYDETDIAWAERLVLVYPTWWASMPAALVEWLDGVLASEPADFAKTPAAAKHLFEKVLMGAAMRADAEVFKETLAKMHHLGAAFGEGALEATLLMESKIGDARSLEAAWAAPRFAASAPHPRSPRLLCRRVEAHARCATYLIRRRDVAKGGRTRGGREDAGGVEGDDAMVRAEARRSRVAASEALDELYAATSEATAFATKVSHPRDVRDATTALAGAYAVVGDSDAIRALMERAAAVGVAPDQHVFNALLRSEACARREDEDEDEDEDAAASEEESSSGASGSPSKTSSTGTLSTLAAPSGSR